MSSDKKNIYPKLEEDRPLLQGESSVPPPYTAPQGPPPPAVQQYQQYHAPPPQGYPHPHPQGNPPQGGAAGASVMASPLILMRPPTKIESLGSQPGVVVCQHCHYVVLTETEAESGSCTYLASLGMFLLGITSCGCCLLPFCMTSTKDVMHSCPNCHEDIGLYSRIKERTFQVRADGHHH